MAKHPGIYISDLHARDGRTHGKRWWFLVRVRGAKSSRAFADEDRGIGLEWAKLRRAEMERGDFTPVKALMSEALPLLLAELSGSKSAKKIGKRSAGRVGRCQEYIDDVRRVVEDAIAHGVEDLGRNDILMRAQKWISDDECAPITKRRKIAHVKAVADCARINFKLKANPLADLSVVVPEMGAPAVFTLDECRILVSDSAINTDVGLLCCIALYSGLRLREATFLRWEDVRFDPAEQFISIEPPTDAERAIGARLKRNKSRCALLMPELRALLESRRKASGYVVMDDRIRTWTTKSLSDALKNHFRSLGIDPGDRTFHSLRHTFAGLGLACGVDSMHLQLAMGHTSSDLTKHYAQSAQRIRATTSKWPRGEICLRPDSVVAVAL